VIRVGKGVRLGPSGTVFSSDVLITVPYNDRDDDGILDDSGASESNVEVAIFDPITSTLTYPAVIARDTSANTVSVVVRHFSIAQAIVTNAVSSCNFSEGVAGSGIERCYDGVGPQCSLMLLTRNYNTCMIEGAQFGDGVGIGYGAMSGGSILHDECCVRNYPTKGFMCYGNLVRTEKCAAEWDEAVRNADCLFEGLQWGADFGPYPIENIGDDTTKQKKLPGGKKIHPFWADKLCISTQCTADSQGRPIIEAPGKRCERCECATNATLTGTWTGTYASEIMSPHQFTCILAQSGTNITGTFNSSNGARGNISGTVSENIAKFTLTETTPTCTGTFSTIVTVNGYTAAITFTGSNCLGIHTNGYGSVTKQ